MWVIFSNANDMKLFLMVFPRMSLHCKLVSVQYREYENGLLVVEAKNTFVHERYLYDKERLRGRVFTVTSSRKHTNTVSLLDDITPSRANVLCHINNMSCFTPAQGVCLKGYSEMNLVFTFLKGNL